jgi:hypothetical protein
MAEADQYPTALSYINKSIHYFNASEEYTEKFSESYPAIETYVSDAMEKDPKFKISLSK